MIIAKVILNQLLSLPPVLPEVGGILGSSNNVIDNVVFDHGISQPYKGIYIPDVSNMNRQVKLWEMSGIRFEGIFHTHSTRWRNLSNDDRNYIVSIMTAMPPQVSHLYFPLVFPGDTLIAFIAERTKDDIVIRSDNIIIT